MAVLSDVAAASNAPSGHATGAAGMSGAIEQISRTCLATDIMSRRELQNVRNLLTSVQQLCSLDMGTTTGAQSSQDPGGDAKSVFLAVQCLCRMARDMLKQVEATVR